MEETRLARAEDDDRSAGGAPLDRWGPFERLELVGRGAFGEVYKAFDPTLQRHVALKLLHARGADAEAAAADLLREARALARVRHPNIVVIHGVDCHRDRVGFWSDFVRGRTLADIVASHGPMGPREAALVGIDVCRAVAAVHAAGLLHRDIKAGNVMREDGGRLLLMDFGLTGERDGGGAPSGTPAYMAPELLLGQPATIQSDLYAIGVLLFFLLTGEYPVQGATLAQLLHAHAAGARRSLLDVRPDLPPALARLVDRATDPVPATRGSSAGQMVAALTEATGLHALPARGDAPRRRRVTAGFVAIAVAVVLAVALIPRMRHVPSPPSTGAASAAIGQSADYDRARDLLAHHYRPHALDTAIPLLQNVVARDPTFAPAQADLGRAFLLRFLKERDTKAMDSARAAASAAVALSPNLASAHVTLGTLYAHQGQNDLAQSELDRALQIDRLNAAGYGALADLYDREGRAELVEPTLKKAVSLAPDDWSLVQQLGEYYLDKSRWAEAGEQYRHFVDLAPDNPGAQNNLGLVFRGLDRLDDAAAAFDKAIALEPTALRYRNLGMVLAEAGKYEVAETNLKRAIDMRPDQYRAWGLLGFVYLNRPGDAAQAKGAFLKAIALAEPLRRETPRNAYLAADLGQYFAALGMAKESLPLLAQAAALAPDTPEVLYEVGSGYAALGRHDDALQLLAKARVAGYPATAISRNPQLAALRKDPRFPATVLGIR